jgi:hypothetical protein
MVVLLGIFESLIKSFDEDISKDEDGYIYLNKKLFKNQDEVTTKA